MKNFNNPLKNVRVASPCSQNWDDMMGDERRRFCSQCNLNVYNLSGMTKWEAEKLLLETEGRLCVRFYCRSDGSVLTQDCPVGWRAVKQRVSRFVAAAFGLLAGFFGGVGTQTAFNSTTLYPAQGGVQRPVIKEKEPPLMGAVAYETSRTLSEK